MSNYPTEYLAQQSPFKTMTMRQAKKEGVLREYFIWLLSK